MGFCDLYCIINLVTLPLVHLSVSWMQYHLWKCATYHSFMCGWLQVDRTLASNGLNIYKLMKYTWLANYYNLHRKLLLLRNKTTKEYFEVFGKSKWNIFFFKQHRNDVWWNKRLSNENNLLKSMKLMKNFPILLNCMENKYFALERIEIIISDFQELYTGTNNNNKHYPGNNFGA